MTVMVFAISQLSDSGRVRHEKPASLPVVVGRSPACDIIVDDAYLSARQYVVRASDAGAATAFEVCALESVNPTRLNGAVLTTGQWVPLASGDRIDAGETTIVVCTPDHAVAPALLLPQDAGIWSLLGRMPVAAALFAVALVMTAGWSYLEIWSNEAAMTAAMSVAAVFVIAMIWASLWSVVGRLLTHRSRFAHQLSLASIYVVASLLFGMVSRSIDFVLSGNVISQAWTLLGQTIMLGMLTAGCLAAATTLTTRKRMQAAVSFAAGLMISVVSLTAISNMGFNPVPPFSTTLSPGLAHFVPAVAAQDFIADSGHLFDDADFANVPAQEQQQ